MNLLEYQAKALFREYSIPVPKGEVVPSEEHLRTLSYPCVLKAQVPVGGRGKAGGIAKASSPEEAAEAYRRILGMDIKGHRVREVYAEDCLEPEGELYLSITLDRTLRAPIIMASAMGGVDIESVPEENILKRPIDPFIGVREFHVRALAYFLNLSKEETKALRGVLMGMYRLYSEKDAELVEINPLVRTSDGLVAADAKVVIDNDALYRHPEFHGMEKKELTPLEQEAADKGIAFIQLDGDIGVIANGAGLTMATLDALVKYGGRGGVFLDLGGTDDPEKVREAFELMQKAEPRVILMNVFGGITKCDTVAKGIIEVSEREGISYPVIVRIKVVNEDIARDMLKEAGIHYAETLEEAAKMASEVK